MFDHIKQTLNLPATIMNEKVKQRINNRVEHTAKMLLLTGIYLQAIIKSPATINQSELVHFFFLKKFSLFIKHNQLFNMLLMAFVEVGA
jgi:hypothetical protein